MWHGYLLRFGYFSGCHEILQRVEPPTPPVLGIAKEGPRADDPDDIESNDGQRESPEWARIRRHPHQTEPKQALERVQPCGDETHQDDVQELAPARGPRGSVSMDSGDALADEGRGEHTTRTEDEGNPPDADPRDQREA